MGREGDDFFNIQCNTKNREGASLRRKLASSLLHALPFGKVTILSEEKRNDLF